MAPLTIFLDLGGVITDKEQQRAQWQALVGECFVQLLGGTAEAWTLAHRRITARLENREEVQGQAPVDFVSFYRDYQLQWVRGMCDLEGTPPPRDAECLRLAYQTIGLITAHIQAALPGAVEAIHLPHHLGYTLHLASGSCSRELAGYLEGMGVQHCFGQFYGADLINTFKEGPAYYERLFADAGIEPREALVVDDSLLALGWAAQVGAKTILVSSSSPIDDRAMQWIERLAHLPAWLQQQV